MHLLHELADDALFAGAEGGATSTTVVLLDGSGAMLGPGATAEGSNAYLAEPTAVAALLLRLLAAARAAAGIAPSRQLTALGMGMSGFNELARQQALFKALREVDAAELDTRRRHRLQAGADGGDNDVGGTELELALHANCRLCAFNDSVGALHAAASAEEGGVVLIAGTGSFGQLTLPAWALSPRGRDVGAAGVAATTQGGALAGSTRCGGWGHVVGDEGSAAAIALEALRRILRATDGVPCGGYAAADGRSPQLEVKDRDNACEPPCAGSAAATTAELARAATWPAASTEHGLAVPAARFVHTTPLTLLQGAAVPPYVAAATQAMKEYFGVDRREGLLPLLYPPPPGAFNKAHVAGFTASLASLAARGDPFCVALFECAGEALGGMLRALAARLPLPPPPSVEAAAASNGGWRLRVLCVGSVWKSWPLLKNGFLRGYAGVDTGYAEPAPSVAMLPPYALLRLRTSTACAAGAALVAAVRALGVELPVDRVAQVSTLYESHTEAATGVMVATHSMRAWRVRAARLSRAAGIGLVGLACVSTGAALVLRHLHGGTTQEALTLLLDELAPRMSVCVRSARAAARALLDKVGGNDTTAATGGELVSD